MKYVVVKLFLVGKPTPGLRWRAVKMSPECKYLYVESSLLSDLKTNTGHGQITGEQITLKRKVKGAKEG